MVPVAAAGAEAGALAWGSLNLCWPDILGWEDINSPRCRTVASFRMRFAADCLAPGQGDAQQHPAVLKLESGKWFDHARAGIFEEQDAIATSEGELKNVVR